MRIIYFILFVFISFISEAKEKDTLRSIQSYKSQLAIYNGLGFKSAPFKIRFQNESITSKVKFKHNTRGIYQIGLAYKWLGLAISFGLPWDIRSTEKYGQTNFTDIGFKFGLKKTFWDIDLRNYRGYVIKNNSETISKENLSVNYFGINSWFFLNDQFRMAPVFGIRGIYKQNIGTFYVRTLFDIGNVNNEDQTILTEEFHQNEYQSQFNAATSVNIGVVPGYAQVIRYKDWQISGFGGLGVQIQSKFFDFPDETRGVLGLSPKVDLRLVAGYTKNNYFFWLVSDFDIQTIRYQNIRYTQTFYSLNLIGGYRFKSKNK